MLRLTRCAAFRELRREEGWELPASFIDVVFLLLIFFLCASKFREGAFIQEAKLMSAEPGGGVSEALRLEVLPAGAEGRAARYRIAEWEGPDADALAAHLARLRRTGDHQVVIDGAGGCAFGQVSAALDACLRAGLSRVSFTAEEEAPGAPAG